MDSVNEARSIGPTWLKPFLKLLSVHAREKGFVVCLRTASTHNATLHQKVARNAGLFVLDARSETHTRWQGLTGSTARSNSSKQSGTLLWHLDRKRWKGLRDGAVSLDVQETQQYRSLVGTALYVGQDRPETQHATKEAARFMSDATRAAKCVLKRLCECCSEAPVLSWSFTSRNAK